jgi:2-keto-4-pentenoate hydratase/2-oxohepta-3-ene-1,7-dioic acid hydratase in catechol pathway
MMWSIPEIIAFASQNEVVLPGELIGSGTVGFGSGLELYKRLEPGDVVELEITGLGVLRNRIGARAEARWRPEPKQPTDEEDRGGGESVE